ncbi:hypothetical protein CSPX01_00172 [Colletotrichum filicis]|nr:hypothetical protein CSPX01_00172 [Colletotrichum filicis]
MNEWRVVDGEKKVESPGAGGRSTGDGRGESASAQELADVGFLGGRVAHCRTPDWLVVYPSPGPGEEEKKKPTARKCQLILRPGRSPIDPEPMDANTGTTLDAALASLALVIHPRHLG